jgi:hypothetical protein
MSNTSVKHRHSVRKTLTIDGDLADAIQEQLQQSANLKEKDVVNRLLRSGLNAERELKNRPVFKLPVFTGGLRKGITPEKLEELLDEI